MSAEDLEAGARAVGFGIGELWDVCRGVHAAYQVDTGKDLDLKALTWDQLPAQQKAAFILNCAEPMWVLMELYRAVARSAS